MISAAFDYARPETLDEAVRTLHDGGEDTEVLAGGQSLIPMLRLRLALPELLVDLGRIPELRGVREDPATGSLVIGAITHHDVIHDPLVRRHAGLLAAATETVADPAVRHRGTLGGSLCHADPAGDLPAVLLALDGETVAAGPRGRRTVPAAVTSAADAAAEGTRPATDLSATPEYRAHLARVLTRRAVPAAAGTE